MSHCPYYGTCGGCSLQHLSEDDYKTHKTKALHDILAAEGVDISVITDAIFLGPGQRRRIDIDVKKFPAETAMGFHERGRKRILSVNACPAVHPEISRLLKPLREVFDHVLDMREKAHVYITKGANGIDVLVSGLKRKLPDDSCAQFQQFAGDYGLARLQIKQKRAIQFTCQTADPVVQFGSRSVPISANVFLQASESADKTLADLVVANIPEESRKVCEVYCGRGTLSIPIADAGHRVTGYESDKRAVQALASVDHPNITVVQRDLFATPLSAEEIAESDILVADPPRTGMASMIPTVIASGVGRIIYVSCGPESFARDVKALCDSGYVLDKAIPVDQFHWTEHIEVVGVLSKG
ncbi:MAG: class I SAM-dependent RNA methyltransferase [Alphaproteobacteria bacterium]